MTSRMCSFCNEFKRSLSGISEYSCNCSCLRFLFLVRWQGYFGCIISALHALELDRGFAMQYFNVFIHVYIRCV